MSVSIDTAAIQVPANMLRGWQETVDLLARIVEIPAALIMRVHADEIEVFVKSNSPGNPYEVGEKERLNQGLYCETVISTRAELQVTDALQDPLWCRNPDIKLGMISYCGQPLYWPNGDPFGTICILDRQSNSYSDEQRDLLSCFQNSVESGLQVLYQKAELQALNQGLEKRIEERTKDLKKLNRRLSKEIDCRISTEKILDFQLHYDAMTGVPKVGQLKKSFSKRLAEGQGAALLSICLRNLKAVRDGFGETEVDRHCINFINKLKPLLPPDVSLFNVAWGEYCLWYPESEAVVVEKSAELADRLCHYFMNVSGNTTLDLVPRIDVGIAVYPDDSEEIDILLRKSGIACHSIKADSTYAFCFYDPATQDLLNHRLSIESRLGMAISNNEFELHYQPFVCTDTHKIVGAEALLRWNNSELGWVSPERFIPVAEQTGHILEIGYFVFRTAIEQAARWREMLADEFYIAVNVSPMQFRDPELAENILNMLDLYGLPYNSLELEITEGVLLQDEYQAADVLQNLVDAGVRVSLDDFGTGYSSLSYLQRYPFDTIKIDRSFISRLEENARDQELVRAVIAMAHKLGLQVVAEGVEEPYQAHFIRQEACNIGQGYFYGRPIDSDNFWQKLLNPGFESPTQLAKR